MDSTVIDKLHGAAVCSLGLLLHGNEKTDRAAAQRAVEEGIDALARAASGTIREPAAKAALVQAELDVAVGEAARITRASTQPDADTALGLALGRTAGLTKALELITGKPAEVPTLTLVTAKPSLAAVEAAHAAALEACIQTRDHHDKLMHVLEQRLDGARRRLERASKSGKAVS